MEFYADASSLLIALYEVLIIIFNYINQFWAEQNLSKIIIFFKDLEESGLNVKKRGAQIQELLDITGAAASPSKTSQINSSKELLINRNDNSQNLKKKDSKDIDSLQEEEVQIYNAKKGKNPDKREKENEKTKPTGKKSKAKNKGRNNENDYYDDYSDNNPKFLQKKRMKDRVILDEEQNEEEKDIKIKPRRRK